MGCNLDAVTDCIEYIVGSWAATAVDEAVTGGASAGVNTLNSKLATCLE